ncbi:phage tail assembly protein [Enterobacter cancerogenus]|uniref:phage tail assembly protein n=1 Tax=Enterobacter cancerogenus TaxID=69218 RepID=UPI00384D82F6
MEQPLEESLTIELDKPICTLNGRESWEQITLHEPNFNEVDAFYKESRSSSEFNAMASLIATVSGVNLMAIKALPIRKFREAQAYLLGFLNYFPSRDDGKTP